MSDDRVSLEDLRNPDREITAEEMMEDIMDVFDRGLTPLLGWGTLLEQVHMVVRPLISELISTVGHGIADEIAERLGHKALVYEHVGEHDAAAYWREAEQLVRTHIETAGGAEDAQESSRQDVD
jgi:hypothetical protein